MIPILTLIYALARACGPSAAAFEQQTGISRSVLTTVVDSRNQALIDLDPDEFIVQEGQTPRDVLSVRVADYPIVVLIDNGGAARRDFDLIRKAVSRFVLRLGERPIAIGTLGDPPAMLSSFEDERATAYERLRKLEAIPEANNQILQGVSDAARVIRTAGSPFSAIVVVSADPVDRSLNAQSDLLEPIVGTGTTVHVIANRREVSGGLAGRSPSVKEIEPLRTLVEITRGQFTTIYAAASFQPALDRLADRLATELIVEYIVPEGSLAAEVKLGVKIPGARVRGLGVTK